MTELGSQNRDLFLSMCGVHNTEKFGPPFFFQITPPDRSVHLPENIIITHEKDRSRLGFPSKTLRPCHLFPFAYEKRPPAAKMPAPCILVMA